MSYQAGAGALKFLLPTPPPLTWRGEVGVLLAWGGGAEWEELVMVPGEGPGDSLSLKGGS